ncbi:carboxymuconolactone decarboxylase family protein [Nitrospinota bacterium]
MSRLPDLSPENMSDEDRRIYETFRSSRGELGVTGPSYAWLRSPAMFERLNWMIRFLRNESQIPARLREFIILLTVRTWESRYPWGRHAPMAREAGLAEDIIEALDAERRPDFQNPDEAAVYDFAVELMEHHFVEDATYRAALDLLGERGLVELTVLVGLYSTIGMTINTFEIPPVD